MKKWITALFALLIALTFSVSSAPVEAKGEKVVAYKNCTELNKVYKGGVAQSANVKNKGGKTKYTPFVSKELYNKNTKLDRDKDLIACEK
ncbi:excalibur calcium-binding domain-containing protein [Sporosarcina cyprini]|uniref:excalibur calcium-binding domain-containing protein n=1 Tax=Sporosarcina cyprini TaxID=2910523 RepID=UPI001EDDBA39|nr:excalibur calcium-binding domain-containing protein [Sporosarcina cyprini]MCG3088131.1 excalibur calcium-binding domain-containing protein [Sporosarcina cyprini]